MRDLDFTELKYVTGASCSPTPPTCYPCPEPTPTPTKQRKGNNGFGNGGGDGSPNGKDDSNR